MTDTRPDRTLGALLGLLVVVITLWAATIPYGLGWEALCPGRGECGLAGCEQCDPTAASALAGAAIWLGGIALLLGGLWSAWRAGSGRWSLRRRRPESAA